MTAHEKRLEIASTQRMQTTRDKWVAFADRLRDSFSTYTQNNGISLGDKVKFTIHKSQGRGRVSLSVGEGVVFGLGENTFVVVYKGRLETINYPTEGEE